ncbi:HNH endonuclease [uncultured Corynebacterium sp.]|uniref:HNH endonuclease n=1 Tax=uncultured Corynebacterium sp. TaxID=159447 RepID=UPI002596F77E|nr:HNH endonuclease [uncultured Corynebacterium sp.]
MAAREYRDRQPKCSVDGCVNRVIALGLCGSHYSTKWRKINPGKASLTRSRYRARKRGAFVEDVDSLAVFERDKWTCGICGEPIPKRAKWPDVKSASVDHVVPLNCGGKHEMKNVQAAHLGCNSAKRDKGAGDQLALI